MPTIKDVSKAAGVSTATVSRVVNQKGPVSQEAKEAVFKAMAELGYRPNTAARSLATRRTNAVGVVVNSLSSQFYGQVLQGVEEAVEAGGKHMVVACGHSTPEQERRAVEFLLSRTVDALILNLESLSDYDVLHWRDQGHNIILVNRRVEEMTEASVYLENERGGAMAVRRLLEGGHRKIAHLSGPLSMHDARMRLQGHRRALEQAGIPYDPFLVVEGDFQEDGGFRAAARLLARGVEFTAVFASNDQMAAGAMIDITNTVMSLPRDVSIVGFDDVRMAAFLHPELTTVRQPMTDMGRAAGKMAVALAEGKSTENIQNVFEPELVERASVRRVGEAPSMPAFAGGF